MQRVLNSGWDFVGLRGSYATDLPKYDQLQVVPHLAQVAPILHQILTDYHAITKNLIANLGLRIQALQHVQAELAELSWPEALLTWKTWLLTRAANKASYLEALLQIEGAGYFEDEALRRWHAEGLKDWNQSWLPLQITENLFAAPDHKVYWGNYFHKTLDPCHRYLPQCYCIWDKQRASQANYPHFLLWLEDFSGIEFEPWFVFFDEAEQRQLLCHVRDDLLCQASGRALNCAERTHFLFVFGLDEQLYLAREHPQLCHASFTRSRPVLASGLLQARAGRITHLKFASGHYISSFEHWWQCLELLSKLGYRWREDVRLTIFQAARFKSFKVGAGVLAHKQRLKTLLGEAF